MTAMINLPQLSVIRIMYGMGISVSGVIKPSPTDGRILLLVGEGGQVYGPPQGYNSTKLTNKKK